jgi:hypothetical protein
MTQHPYLLTAPAPSFRTPPDPPEGLVADRPREWFSELLFDGLSIPDPVLG